MFPGIISRTMVYLGNLMSSIHESATFPQSLSACHHNRLLALAALA